MPSDPHEPLYRNLWTVSSRVEAALTENRPEELPALLAAHRQVMADLQQAGPGRDPGLLALLENTRRQVGDLVARMVRQRDDLARQLVNFGRQKKAAGAYAGNTRRKIAR